MKIYLSNQSTVLSDAEVAAAYPAFKRYLSYVAGKWGAWGGASLILGAPPTVDEWQIVVLDDSDQAGALGYHDYTPTGKPISKIFAKTDLKYGYSWTVTLTHELSEMIADPFISACMMTSNTREYAVEVGDPVEADALGFNITISGYAPVLCSDFALPGWFIPGHPPPYDYKNHCSTWLQVLPGGYAQYTDSGSWHQVNAEGTLSPVDAHDVRFRNRVKRLQALAAIANKA